MNKEKELTKNFFDESGSRYSEFTLCEKSKDIRAKMKEIIDKEIYGKKAIDLGGAGEIYYGINKTSFFVSFDISFQLLRKAGNTKFMYAVCGDVECLPFKNRVFDRSICGFLLHHLVSTDLKKSDEVLNKVLSGIFQILSNQGKVIIIENCLPKIFEKIEKHLFILLKKILEFFRKPTVKFLSYESIGVLLENVGFKDVKIIKIEEKKNRQLVPVGMILPFFKIPHKLIPTSLHIITGKKP